MTLQRPPTDLWVHAQTRLAAQDGVPITVLRRGNADIGMLLLKINLLNGMALIFTEAYCGDARFWTPILGATPMLEKIADDFIDDQARADPDLWLVEIEDKKGRLWFPGKILDLDAPPPSPF